LNIPSDPWNGTTGDLRFATQIANYFTPFDGCNQQGAVGSTNIINLDTGSRKVTANAYPNLVYTQSIRILL
jgi:hypothetical protein